MLQVYDAHTDDQGKPVLDNEEDIFQFTFEIEEVFPMVKFKKIRLRDASKVDPIEYHAEVEQQSIKLFSNNKFKNFR